MDVLTELVGAYNRYISKKNLNPNIKNEIGTNSKLITIKSDKGYLLTELKKRFETICQGDEQCITEQNFMNEIAAEMRDDILTNTFKPYGPEKSTEWLSTGDIDGIMQQYQNVYPEFYFFGAVPLDCDDYSFCQLSDIKYAKLEKEGYHKFGIVYNLDKYGQSGSHWIAIFANSKTGEIYFCDSIGRPPFENMLTVINNFINYYEKKTGKKATYKYNNKSYQRDGSECGVYSCNFIIRILGGETFDQIINNPLEFKRINSCRNLYFRNKTSQQRIDPLCDPKISTHKIRK